MCDLFMFLFFINKFIVFRHIKMNATNTVLHTNFNITILQIYHSSDSVKFKIYFTSVYKILFLRNIKFYYY